MSPDHQATELRLELAVARANFDPLGLGPGQIGPFPLEQHAALRLQQLSQDIHSREVIHVATTRAPTEQWTAPYPMLPP
ncbi:MAG: hypothetical protein JW940_03350, partial [Polyangiaceae bacterium]|nr:hypothetical protein [Polyangiaceae bacterium]